MRVYNSNIIEIFLTTLVTFKKIPNIYNKMILYQNNLNDFLLLFNWQNFYCNYFFLTVIILYLLNYICSK